jgi:hypothetical protein
MRLFRVLPALSLLFGARASSLDSRAPAPHRNDVRDLLDVCASLDTEVVVPDQLGILTAVGVIGASNIYRCIFFNVPAFLRNLTDMCLCLSALPVFLETNIVAILAVTIAGDQVVTAILTSLVRGRWFFNRHACLCADHDLSLFQLNEAAPQNCNYPTHSTPACVNENPCGFSCTDGFTASPPTNPTTCVCSPPSVVCNGVCQAIGACPSSQPPSKKKRSWVGSGSCSDMGPGWAACGVFGGGPRAWECVDTARDLESCKCALWPRVCSAADGSVCFSVSRWWLHVPPYGLLPRGQGLLDPPWRCGRLLHGGRMRRPPLLTRIQARSVGLRPQALPPHHFTN